MTGAIQQRFATRMRTVREFRGMPLRTLSEVTEELGLRIAPSTLTKMELGACKVDLDQAGVISTALGVTVAEMTAETPFVLTSTAEVKVE